MASSQNTAVGAYTCTGGDARAAYVQQKDYKKQEWPNRSVLERFSSAFTIAFRLFTV